MLETFQKIWKFAGDERDNINKSIVFCFINAVFGMFEIAAVYLAVRALTGEGSGEGIVWKTVLLIAAGIIGKAATKTFSQLEQTHAGYFMAGNKRIAIGNQLKSVPMGYFNENSLGEITGVTTTVLENVETIAPMVLVGLFAGMINTIVFNVMVLVYDWRAGLLVVAWTFVYLLIVSKMEKKSRVSAPKRQESEAKLVAAVLEQVQGMSVIKSFNLVGRGDRRIQEALEYNRSSNLELEQLFTPYTIAEGLVIQLFSVLMMVEAVVFYLNGTLSMTGALMFTILSFVIFAQIQTAGSSLSVLRLVSSSIEQANRMDEIPQMDEKGSDITPEHHEIAFHDVHFSYEKKEILKGINLTIPDKTTAAFIGPSGSGKTTLCNLIARFWDVDGGSITVGGRDVRDYTLEALMNQISMVFQNVYLFADIIENNIKFGRPEATHEEVVAAAKKACCDEFIEALPDGYQTVIGEGGASLSGGEKQRISIARAMLKDAPIVILDEATANVDPENEERLQRAIEELTRDKTIIMIAHRLKTVCHADQIFVVNDGGIVQRGTHEELIGQPGIYADFVSGRKEAGSWKL